MNTALLVAAARLASESVDVSIYSDLAELPPFNPDLDGDRTPVAVTSFRSQLEACDALLISSPEYAHGVPGVLKNAIDWLSRMTPQPFAGKPMAQFGASGGPLGTARAQYHLRQMMVFLDGRPVNKPEVMIGQAQNRFTDGKLNDEATGKLLADLAASLVLAIRHAKAAAAHVK